MRWTLLAAVVAVAGVVGWTAFNPAPHTGGDNAGYVALAYSLLEHGTYTEVFDPVRPPHTKYPPVFPLLLAGLMALGARTWVSLKAVAFLSTLGAVAFTYLWAERRLGAVWGAGVALVLALSSAVVYYSHWILSDPTFLFFTVLAVWALERADEGDGADGGDGAGERRRDRADGGPGTGAGRERGSATPWLVVGVVGAGLAYFTRSAGLPLVVAVVAWLALRRRWRALVVTAVGLGVPALLWMLRSRGVGTADYTAEFWLLDPYDPGRGRVGVGGLLARFLANLQGYVGTHLPGGVVGGHGVALVALGVALVALALVGWYRRGRARPGPAELFLPLYAGLILLWPQIWSGDRFALPLYPLLFVYGASALKDVVGARSRTLAGIAGATALLVLVLPAGRSWMGQVQEAQACGAAVRLGGPFACYGPRVGAFVEAAGWAGANLPEGSSVLTRKPRIFFALSGVPSRTFPFDESTDAHLSLAASLGTRYELVDQWDGQAGRYVVGAVRGDPGAFCSVRGFGEGWSTQLLGILGDRRGEGTADEASVRIQTCPGGYVVADGSAPYDPSSPRIPLLDGLDR
jgi:4-amino-4-deoxy-L-arabinose transferase-like glycosyltransferase